MDRNDIQRAIESGKTALGIELGSTRIKAVLIGEDHMPIASESHEWENRYENGIWTYSLEDVWTGLQESYRNLSKEVLEKYNIKFHLKLPHVAFHRHIGEFKDAEADIDGNIVSSDVWEKKKDEYLPSSNDRDFIESLMKTEVEPGKFASWIAPPKVGIDNKPGDFEYVKIA